MSEFINVPVPADRVQEVYALLGSPSQTPVVEQQSADGLFPKGWDADLIARMYVESPDAMKLALRILADSADQKVWGPDLAKQMNLGRNQLAGTFGAFGRRVANRYARDRWPFDAYRNANDGTYSYEMAASVADVIKKAIAGEA